MFYKYNMWMESMEGGKHPIHRTAKTKDDFSLKTIESTDRHFFIRKLIRNIEFEDHYQNSIEKKPEKTEAIEDSYKVNRRVYQSLFSDIDESFFEYTCSLDPDEIQELDSNVKANGWRVESITEIQNAERLLTIFQIFYYHNGRLSFMNGSRST